MKRLLPFLFIYASTAGFAQTVSWAVDRTHSSVKFTVTHMMVSEVEGSFKVYNGSLQSTGTDFNNATATFSIDVKSVNTDDDQRDGHLKGDDFFNAEKYPTMNFKNTTFKKTGTNTYSVTGDLTIRDVTKKVTFTVVNPGVVKDPYGNTRAGFKATGAISRSAFNLKWNKMLEAGGAVVGDEVSMRLNLEFVHK